MQRMREMIKNSRETERFIDEEKEGRQGTESDILHDRVMEEMGALENEHLIVVRVRPF